jgi:diguanylate cyclase (GGDEF)-like protein/PAS domain S-box-containing protein
MELVRVRKDGQRVTLQLSVSSITDRAGNVVGASTIARDISEKKRSEAALRQSEEQYRLLFESNPVAMYIYEWSTFRIVSANKAAIEQYGYTEQEFLSKTIADIRPEEDIPQLLQDLAAHTTGLQKRGVWRHRRKDGSIFHVEIICHAMDFHGTNSVLVAAQDVTERKRAEDAVRQSEEQYRMLFEGNAIPMWVYDRKTLRFLAANEAAIKQYGYSKEEFLTMKLVDMRLAEDVPALLQEVAREKPSVHNLGVWRHRRKDGTIVNVEIVSHDLAFNGTNANLVAAYDVTERKRAEDAVREAEEKYRGIFENAVIGIFQSDADGRFININRALANMHGYDCAEELLATISRSGAKLLVDSHGMAKLAAEAEERGAVHGAELEIYRKDGTRRWVRVNLRVIRNALGKVVNREGTVEDITEYKSAQERVQFLAYYDALTELPQRALLKDRLEIAMAGARRRREKVALLFIDLDRFKAINDAYGHSFGDIALKDIAKRLKGCTREANTLARIGGDEFLIVLCNLKDPAEAAIAADEVMEAMNANFTIQGRSVNVGCSIGISIFPEHGTDGETLIHNADVAMYAAKDSGRGNVRFFTDEMNAQTLERLTMDNNLRLAIEREEFSLVYQPQMDMEYGRITGFEALIRWNHPEIGPIPPDRFISIAENNGLILPIGEWALRSACAQARKWQNEGLRAVPVAVNVSAVQFCQGGFLGLIRSVLQETGLAPEYMELEITESLLLSDEDLTLSVLRELKAMGVKLSIDDFGTGYSCLSYLKHYPVDKLKIDQSFVRDCVADRDDAAITASIISMAHSLHLKVVAEGVEKEAQMSFLRQHRCDEIQGHYFSKAVPADEAASMLQSEADFGHMGDGIAFEKLFWPTSTNYSGRTH